MKILTGRRDQLAPRLEALGLRVLPSETNFLMCEVGPAAHATEAALRREGLVPGIIYGAGQDPEMFATKHNELIQHLDNEAFY